MYVKIILLIFGAVLAREVSLQECVQGGSPLAQKDTARKRWTGSVLQHSRCQNTDDHGFERGDYLSLD